MSGSIRKGNQAASKKSSKLSVTVAMDTRQERHIQRRNFPPSSPSSPSANRSTLMAKEVDPASSRLSRGHASNYDSPQLVISKVTEAARAVVHMTPAWFDFGIMVGLIFGGCCSNVFALEAIVKQEPDSGLLITFTQFLLTLIFAWPHQFSRQNPPFFLKRNAIPIRRWLLNIVLFFSINILNNQAFGYKISVPVHIILRSGGSVTTILVGWLWGKRFTRLQIISVAFLTIGVIIAAMADAQAQGKTSTTPSTDTSSFITGLFILLFAQILSAIMGLYVQSTYATYGSHWQENLFYSHFLSMPLFIPFIPSMRNQFARLAASPAQTVLPLIVQKQLSLPSQVPRQVLMLALNSLTQLACIRGVNLLAATSSALTVTIVLNIRKLVSLFLSIWLFGNKLAPGVLVGAAVVFGSGLLYAYEGQTKGKETKAREGEKEKAG